MIQVRRSEERGHADHGWLKSYHTFSFADYYDSRHMHFRHLRVINEDWVQPGKGFGTHPHRDMEIITYVLEGALEHKDSMGNGSIIRPGEVQVMSAGSGVTHSEYNHSQKESVHLLQIWILPQAAGIKPGYQQKAFAEKDRKDQWCPIVSPDEEKGSLKIHQDVRLFCSFLSAGQSIRYPMASGRHAWLQLAKGSIQVKDTVLKAGDAAAVSGESSIEVSAETAADILLFDLA